MKQIDSYQFSYCLYGTWHTTQPRSSKRDAMKDMWPIIEKHDGKFLQMTLVRNTRYEAEPTDTQQ